MQMYNDYHDVIAYRVARQVQAMGYSVTNSTGSIVEDLVSKYANRQRLGHGTVGILSPKSQHITKTGKFRRKINKQSQRRLIATINFGSDEAGYYTNDWYVKIYGEDIIGFVEVVAEELKSKVDPLKVKLHYELKQSMPRYERVRAADRLQNQLC